MPVNVRSDALANRGSRIQLLTSFLFAEQIASASNLGGVFAEEYSGNFSSLQKAADQNISADDLQDVAAMFAVKKE